MSQSPIRSAAQHRMLVNAAGDPAYAALRGITQDAARDLLDRHEAAGSPKLPERSDAPQATPSRPKPRAYKLLGAH